MWSHVEPVRVYKKGRRTPVDVYQRLDARPPLPRPWAGAAHGAERIRAVARPARPGDRPGRASEPIEQRDVLVNPTKHPIGAVGHETGRRSGPGRRVSYLPVQIGVRRELAAAQCIYRDQRAAATAAQWEGSQNS
jgi:hypothetical protein